MIRAIVVFFFFLFSLLTGSFEKSYAIHASGHSDTPKYHIEKLQQSKIGLFSHDFAVYKNGNLADKREDFVSISDEDEDLVCSRKQIVASKSIVALACSFTLHHFYNYPKNRLPFCSHLSYTSSYKYILQRVLRI